MLRMKTMDDLTVRELKEIRNLSKDCKITMAELRKLIDDVANKFNLTKETALETIKAVQHGTMLIAKG